MDLTTLVVDLVIVLVIAAILISVARAWRYRPARLTALAPEARSRYVAAWQGIEKRFMDAPEEAAQEADSLLTALLGERGHPMGMDRLPRRLTECGASWPRAGGGTAPKTCATRCWTTAQCGPTWSFRSRGNP